MDEAGRRRPRKRARRRTRRRAPHRPHTETMSTLTISANARALGAVKVRAADASRVLRAPSAAANPPSFAPRRRCRLRDLRFARASDRNDASPVAQGLGQLRFIRRSTRLDSIPVSRLPALAHRDRRPLAQAPAGLSTRKSAAATARNARVVRVSAALSAKTLKPTVRETRRRSRRSGVLSLSDRCEPHVLTRGK